MTEAHRALAIVLVESALSKQGLDRVELIRAWRRASRLPAWLLPELRPSRRRC
jgi:hypothetical protein